MKPNQKELNIIIGKEIIKHVNEKIMSKILFILKIYPIFILNNKFLY